MVRKLKGAWTGKPRAALIGALALSGLTYAQTALSIDWGQVPANEVVMFYPGQASWEWALTQSDHSGNEKFRAGKNCKECHQSEEADIGEKIVTGKKLEPHPIAGKPGSLPVSIQVATEGGQLHVRFRWTSPPPTGTRLDPDTAVHVTMMIGDSSVKESTRAGCWGTCHDDLKGMASATPDSELTKYLLASRTKVTRQGGGENYKSADELKALMESGQYMEYWQAKLNPGQDATPVSGYVLDKRHKDDSPVVAAQAAQEGDTWTVELSRAIKIGSDHHRDLESGKIFNVGFAIHEDYTDHRYHYVSFEHTLVIGEGAADFKASP